MLPILVAKKFATSCYGCENVREKFQERFLTVSREVLEKFLGEGFGEGPETKLGEGSGEGRTK